MVFFLVRPLKCIEREDNALGTTCPMPSRRPCAGALVSWSSSIYSTSRSRAPCSSDARCVSDELRAVHFVIDGSHSD